MLSLFRQFLKPILLLLTIIICVAFGWFYVRYDTRRDGSGIVYGSIYGEEITQREIDRARSHAGVAYQVQIPEVRLLSNLAGGPDQWVGYAAAMNMIRHEAGTLGLSVGQDEIENMVQELPIFQTNGQFDGDKFRAYAGDAGDGLRLDPRSMMGASEESAPLKLSRNHMTIEEFYKTVGDFLLLEKIRAVVGAGIVGPETATERSIAVNRQKISASAVSFLASRYEEGIKPTEEEVQKAYEAKKAAFMTPEKKSFEYVAVAPKTPAATPEAKPEEGKDKAAPPPPAPVETPEQKKARVEVTEKLFAVAKAGGDLAKEAAACGYELKTTPLGSLTELPDEIKSKMPVVSAVNELTEERRVPAPVADGVTWYILRLKEVVHPQQQALADVRADIEKDLIKEKAHEAATKAAKEALAKIKAAVDGGATFEKAAADATLTVEKFDGLDQSSASSKPLARPLINALQFLKPGSLAPEVVDSPDAVLVAYLADRSVEKTPDQAASLDRNREYMTNNMRDRVFVEWWTTRMEDAKFIDHTQQKKK